CLAVVGAIVGEFVGSDRGLGYLLLTSTGTLDGPLVWAALLVLIAMGMALFAIVSWIERLSIPWHVSVRVEDAAAYQGLRRRYQGESLPASPCSRCPCFWRPRRPDARPTRSASGSTGRCPAITCRSTGRSRRATTRPRISTSTSRKAPAPARRLRCSPGSRRTSVSPTTCS